MCDVDRHGAIDIEGEELAGPDLGVLVIVCGLDVGQAAERSRNRGESEAAIDVQGRTNVQLGFADAIRPAGRDIDIGDRDILATRTGGGGDRFAFLTLQPDTVDR